MTATVSLGAILRLTVASSYQSKHSSDSSPPVASGHGQWHVQCCQTTVAPSGSGLLPSPISLNSSSPTET